MNVIADGVFFQRFQLFLPRKHFRRFGDIFQLQIVNVIGDDF